LQIPSAYGLNSPAAGNSASRPQYKTMTTKTKTKTKPPAAPKSAPLAAPSLEEAKATLAATPAAKPAAKLSIQTMSLEQFALYGEGMAGGFCRYDAKRNKAGILTSARLEVPRFRGESFADFVRHFTGSLPEGARLEKPTLDVLRGIFAAADNAAAAFGAEAARVTFSYGRRGLRVDATAYRA
jgi:hypothetical protein